MDLKVIDPLPEIGVLQQLKLLQGFGINLGHR